MNRIFLLFYVWKRSAWFSRKIQPRFPGSKDLKREVFYSFLTILIFAAVVTAVMFHPSIRPWTRLMGSPDQRGWIYYFAVFPILLFLHDTYFYWIHRLMHQPALFKSVHLIHHKSTNPSPWTAYAFHPLEAVLESGIIPLVAFTLPVHKTAFFIFMLFQIVYNVYGHLGYELYPKGFNKTKIGKWINTSVNHNQHHQYFKGNYGLYFLCWDRWMGTLRRDYSEHFEQARPQ